MDKKLVIRFAAYLAGLLILAFGLTMNVMTGLGVSPIISVSYVASEITGIAFADATFILYALFVIAELLIHLRLRCLTCMQLIKDVAQLPLSLLFTRFLALFQAILPDLSSSAMAIRLLALMLAVIATGVGAASTLSMRLIPNPGDGIVQAFADLFRRPVGMMKNIIDGVNVCISLILGLALLSRIAGIGAGTVLSFLGVGRIVALYNATIGKRIAAAAGVSGDGGNRTLQAGLPSRP